MTSVPLQGEPKHQAVPITSEDVVINGSGFGKILFEDGAVTFYRKTKRWIKFQSYLKGTLFTPTARAIDSNTITYQGGKYFQAHYEFWDDSYKETITLKDAPQSQRFNLSDLSFLITTSEGTHVSQQANGDLWLMRTENERCLMVIPAPTAVDANSVAYPVAWSYNESTQFLTITGSLTGATYPVTIDPSVELDTAVDTNATAGSGRHICRDTAGRIWTIHIDDYDIEVNYSDDNGATFTQEEPWTSKYDACGTSIAIDSSRNVHASWCSQQVVYHYKRTHSSSSWAGVSITTSGGFGDTQILVDSSDVLYCLWYDVNAYSVQLAVNSGSGWGGGGYILDVQALYNYDKGFFSAAMDSSGYVHIAYMDESSPIKILHRVFTTSWESAETVDAPASVNDVNPVIAIDTSGKIHVAYVRDTDFFYRSKPSGGSWSSEETITTNPGQNYPISIGVDKADNPFVGGPGQFAYNRVNIKTGNGWVETSLGGTNVAYASYAFAYFPRCPTYAHAGTFLGGTLSVTTEMISSKYYAYFYQSNDFQPANCETIYSCQLGGSASSEITLAGSYSGARSGDRNISRSASGRIWVVFNKTLYNLFAKYSDNEGKTWVETSISEGTTNTAGSSLAVDSNGDVHVVYGRYVNPRYEIKYKKYSSSAWGSEEDITISSSIDQVTPVIALDSSNYPHVAWRDGAFVIRYRYKTSGGWQTVETVTDGGTDLTALPAIAIDASNDIHVTFVNNTDLVGYYIKRTSGTWGSATSIYSDSSTFTQTAIVLTSDGYVWAAGVGGPGLSVATNKTGSWAVNEPTLSLGQSNPYLGMSIDQDNVVWILFNSTTNTLKYIRYTTSWQTSVTIFDPAASSSAIKGGALIWAYSSDKRSIPDTGAMAVFVCDTISTSYRDVYVWKSSDLTWSAGVQQVLISISSTATATLSKAASLYRTLSQSASGGASLVRTMYKSLSVTETTSNALTTAKMFLLSLSVTEVTTPALSLVKSFYRSLSATTGSASLSLIKSFYRTLSYTETTAPSLSRLFYWLKSISTTSTSSPSLTRKIPKTLSATSTETATLVRMMPKLLSYTELASATLTKILTWARLLSVTESASVSLTRGLNVLLSYTETVSATLGAIKQLGIQYVEIAITSVSNVTLSLQKSLYKTLSATTGSAILTTISTRYKSLSVVETASATLTKINIWAKPLSVIETTSNSLSRKMYKLASVTEIASTSLSTISTRFRTLSVVETTSNTLSQLRQFYRSLSIVETSTSILTTISTWYKSLSVTSTTSTSLNRVLIWAKSISVVSTFNATLAYPITWVKTLLVTETSTPDLIADPQSSYTLIATQDGSHIDITWGQL